MKTHKRNANILRRGVVCRFRKTATPAFFADKQVKVVARNQFSVCVELLEDVNAAYRAGERVTVAPSELSHPAGCDCRLCRQREKFNGTQGCQG